MAPYVGGGGFVLSGALLQPLSSLSRIIPVFPIDDVYTRMRLQAVGVSPEENSGFKTFDIEEDRENLCVHKNLILVHQRSPPADPEAMERHSQSPLDLLKTTRSDGG